VPQADYEKGGGVEDPRLVKFGEIYYLTHTGDNKKDAQLCLATSTDLVHWQRKGMAKKNDRYLLYYGDADKYRGVAEAELR
jgi:predicted GH43/DUF377 family glycosyl hydrolase